MRNSGIAVDHYHWLDELPDWLARLAPAAPIAFLALLAMLLGMFKRKPKAKPSGS